MQKKPYIDFDLLFDSISATAFGLGYMVPTSQFFEGFMCSSLVHVGYIVYPFSSNVIDVSKHILAWLTKCTHASKLPGVFDFLHVVKAK